MLLACDAILGIRGLDVEPTQPSAPPDQDAAPTDDGGTEPPISIPPTESDAAKLEIDGASGRRVFVMSSTSGGNLGGVNGANQKCTDAAKKANLGSDWVAWLGSDGKKAIDALVFEGPYVLLDGTLIASNKMSLTEGSLPALINIKEDGSKIGDLWGAWTGTRSNGDIGATCSNWTSSSPIAFGTGGDPKKKDKAWTDTADFGCGSPGRLYCFEL